MKKFCVCIVSILLLCTSIIIGNAAGTTKYLSEPDLTITIPSEFYVFTKDIKESDPSLSQFNLTKSDVLDILETNNFCLDAIDKNVNYEIAVTVADSDFTDDFNLLGESLLKSTSKTLTDAYENIGIDVIKTKTYQHSQALFFVCYFCNATDSSRVDNGLQYYTVYNSKAINITLHSYVGEISSENEKMMKTVIDGTEFGTEPQTQEPDEKSDSFIYKHDESGIQFTVPANWHQEELNEKRECLKAKFTKDDYIILFGWNDVLEDSTDFDLTGLSRKDINNSLFEENGFLDKIAEEFDIATSDISKKTVGGKDYFVYEIQQSSDDYGIPLTVKITTYFRYENGYYYQFQFSGTNEDTLFSDFTELLESVEYPSSKSTGKTSESSTTYAGSSISNSSESNGLVGFLVFVAVVVLITVCVVIVCKKRPDQYDDNNNHKSDEMNSSPEISKEDTYTCPIVNTTKTESIVETKDLEETDISLYQDTEQIAEDNKMQIQDDVITEPENIIINTQNFCRKCGAKLYSDSLFCSKCGTKVEEME